MSYLALYRKYRPVDFNNVYGQEEVVTVLKNAILNNKISHAYLFSGPRGTGKTTIAKIIARLVNCENLDNGNPCGKCYNCLNFANSNDIVEIDAASNNGVDEIRELRDKINLVPSNSKYKVYIIDEVHMLTNQAFNALLKTLEEPPSHVIFILATTEPHKIPLTISSRCQKFRFSKINDNMIVDRLREICELESISIDNDSLFEIARLSDGGMRDAINLLDQLVAYCNSDIHIDDIYNVNGSVSYNDLFNILNFIKENDKEAIINFVDYLGKSGKEINKFVDELIIFIKDVILFKNTNTLSSINVKNENIVKISDIYSDNILYNLIENLNDVNNVIKISSHGLIIFMTSILKFSDSISNFTKDKDRVVLNNDNKIISQEIKNENICDDNDNNNFINENNGINKHNLDIRINNAFALANKNILNDIKNKWHLIDDYLYDDNYSVVAGLLRDSSIVVASNEYVILSCKFESIANRINDLLDNCEKLFEKLFEYKVYLVAVSEDEWNIHKNNYIKNVKSGIKYTVKELDINKEFNNKRTPVDDLIDLVGENIIEYK